jgi:eukaryotic-like serine/threonine-protein kinase
VESPAFRRIDRFLVGPRLGSGGTATVYLAQAVDAPGDAAPVALKIVHEHLAEESEFLDQFADEAAILLRLAHPSIVKVRAQGRAGTTPYLSMEYLDGQPLSRFVSALARRGERLSPAAVAWLGARVAEGLAYAHTASDADGQPLGLIHRDISPQNIFVTYDGEIKIIDFGIARARGRLSRTTQGKVKGKFSYMAPEQLLSANFDHRADLFALGATLYEAAVGERLFAALEESEALHRLLFEEIADPRQHVPELPAELARIIMWALAREPDARPGSAAELASALDAFVATSSEPSPQLALAERARQLFGDERARRAGEIAELARGSRESAATLRPLAEGKNGRSSIKHLGFAAAIAIAAASLIAGAVFGRNPAPPPPAPAPAAVAEQVQLEISIRPPVAASISIAGQSLRGPTASLRLPRGAARVPLEISAPGYQIATRVVVPDRDRALEIELLAERAPVPPLQPSAGSARKLPPASKDKPKRPKDSLVTDYPY